MGDQLLWENEYHGRPKIMGDQSAVIKYKFAENKSLYVLPCICNIKIIRWQETIEI